jgi:hypothetical protein
LAATYCAVERKSVVGRASHSEAVEAHHGVIDSELFAVIVRMSILTTLAVLPIARQPVASFKHAAAS